MSVQIKFCGAAGTVTGSCYWIKTPECQFLVDCGMFQGTKTLKELNYQDFPFDPKQIDFVLITHAHTDHSALIPKLFVRGYSEPVYCTEATADLLRFMLPDSGYIQETEVDRLNHRNRQKGRDEVDPIYTQKDAEASLSILRAIPFEEWVTPTPGIRARYWNAGHILGSASIELEIDDGSSVIKMLFSGDLGPDCKLFYQQPDAPTDFDYVICESTYGGRQREDFSLAERRDVLAKEINDAMNAGGSLVIPSFAVERTQELLLDISSLMAEQKVNCSTVFLDSPLAIKITSIFTKYADTIEDVGHQKNPFMQPTFHFTETVDESKSIARFVNGSIILAASGMCDAGRIRHHLKNHLWRPNSTILLVGFQAEGTLGRLLEKGVKTVRIQGEQIKVKARIRKLDCYSAHADGNELVNWIKAREPIRHNLFLTHGGEDQLAALKSAVTKEGFSDGKVIIPELDAVYQLTSQGAKLTEEEVPKRLSSKGIDQPDWHNELAQLGIDIRAKLDATQDDKTRKKLLDALRQALK